MWQLSDECCEGWESVRHITTSQICLSSENPLSHEYNWTMQPHSLLAMVRQPSSSDGQGPFEGIVVLLAQYMAVFTSKLPWEMPSVAKGHCMYWMKEHLGTLHLPRWCNLESPRHVKHQVCNQMWDLTASSIRRRFE